MEDFLSPGSGPTESRSSVALHLPRPPGTPRGNIHLTPFRAQPCRLVAMTSVVKTVYTLQTPSVLSGSLTAGGCPRRPRGTADWPRVVRAGNPAGSHRGQEWGARTEGPDSPLIPLELG